VSGGADGRVAIVMGSDSDHPVMAPAAEVLRRFGVAHVVHCVSAHRDPHAMLAFADRAAAEGIDVIIAGAGGAAHLPGMIASATELPVIGVPVGRPGLGGIDALLSIAQMPAGIPVATMAVDGAVNAGLLAVRILAGRDPGLRAALRDHRADLRRAVAEKDARITTGWNPPSPTDPEGAPDVHR
jgi:5-(carboxyamino)imidazole ribonucleotide mutase